MPDVEAYLELDLDDPRAWEFPQARGQFTTGWDLHRVQTALIDNTVTGITPEARPMWLWCAERYY